MTQIKDEATVKIHTDDHGHVWYVDGVGPPQNSEKTHEEFLRSAVVNKLSAQVRLLGVPSNADLIVELFRRRQKKEIADVQVAGPNGSVADLNDPVHTLLKMRALTLSPSCGGWHSMTPIEYATYVLLAQLQKNQFSFGLESATFFRLNPMHKFLRFIPEINDASCAMLLATIIDPRWYVDARMPDRSSKIELFLGLTPKVQRRVSDEKTIVSKKREIRCATVLNCWKTRKPEDVDFTAPQEFLYRVWRAAGEGATGDLRASQMFVRFIRLNWLDLLDPRRGRRDGIFVPSRFFKTPVEIKAFKSYMQAKKE